LVALSRQLLGAHQVHQLGCGKALYIVFTKHKQKTQSVSMKERGTVSTTATHAVSSSFVSSLGVSPISDVNDPPPLNFFSWSR
jgi:hypothetical protein